MQKKFGIAVVTALLAAPVAAAAQGIPGGMERGAAEGNAVGGPVGGVRLRGLSGARDEFHLAAIVQNLKTLALRTLGPPTRRRASYA
jgi:hypothetical protein